MSQENREAGNVIDSAVGIAAETFMSLPDGAVNAAKRGINFLRNLVAGQEV